MANEHVKLANPRLADGHPRQVAHELLTAVGLGFVFYGPGDAVACFQALAQLSPALRDTDGHNESSYLAVLRGRPGIFWLCFQGPNGSAIALCVTSDADIDYTTEHFAARFNDARPPWQWGICTGGGNVHADCARIIDSAEVVELHALPGLQHIPADVSGELPTELAAGLAQRGWEPAGSGLKKDIALIGGGMQTAFVFSRHNQTFGVVTQIGNTVNGVVPERLRARQEAPYIVEAAGDLVVMCQPIAFDDPTAIPEYVDAAGNVLVTYAVAPHITLGSLTTPAEHAAPPLPQPPPSPTTPTAETGSDLAYSAPTAPLVTPPRPVVAPPPPRSYVTPSSPAPNKSPAGPPSQRLIIAAIAAVAVVAITIWAITTNTEKENTSAKNGYSTPRSNGYDTGSPSQASPGGAAPTYRDPVQQLRQIADGDHAYVSAQLADHWVPQLSSKRPGVIDEGRVWDNAMTLQEHQQLRQRFPQARLLWSGEWSTFSAPDFWVTVVGITFPNSAGALAWCRDQGFDRDHCIAKIVSTTHPVDGSTAYN